jgi:hypothetical protein
LRVYRAGIGHACRGVAGWLGELMFKRLGGA